LETNDPKACTTTTNLAEAASFIWGYDCGILPVVGDEGRVVGLITDRDIYIGGATKHGNLSNIVVEEIRRVPDVSFRDVVQTYKAICAHTLSAEQGAKSMAPTA